MADTVIELRDATRIYRMGDTEVRALDGVSLRIARGEFVAIMGSSGSGKSTLMNLLGCLDQPTGGSYRFEGVDVAGLDEPQLARLRSERLGFVFQTFNLLPRTSALENVALPLFYSGAAPARRSERFDRARAALQRLGLAGRERNSPGQLSGGQQQRVAIARALINNPAVLLADEPTGNLDTRTSHEIMQLLRRLNREQGVTVIVVTHEPDIAAFTDRVITMRDGRIVSDEANAQAEPAAAAAQAGTEVPAPPPQGAERPSATRAAATRPAEAPFAARALASMIVASAAQAIWRNLMRSTLTMLGVFIGVAALIAMVAVGQGANEAVKQQISSLGTDLIVVLPGAMTSGGARGGFGSASTLTVADAQAIRRDDPAVSAVSYLIRQVAQVQYANRNWGTSIFGIGPGYTGITNWHIAAGRDFSDEDHAGAATVALVGSTVAHQLFGDYENPVGAIIQIKGTPVRIVGLLQSKGQTGFGQDQDDVVLIPYSAAERKVLGVAAPTQTQSANPYFPAIANPYGTAPRLAGYVNVIYVQAVDGAHVAAALQQVTDTLSRRHRIRRGEPTDFAVRNLSQIAETAQGSSRIMALLLAIIASISLLVGGIGIMNILLVSVTERTREIGLRMAVGARRVQVLLQFLAEAVFLSASGGLAGIVFGVAISEAIALLSSWPTRLSTAAIGGGFFFSAAVGIFFGYYPARKASRLNPIEALRYE
jgi:macrolide transport system ATP-binding/permease protein